MKTMPKLVTSEEEVVEEALLKRRSNTTIATARTISDGSTHTTVSSFSSTGASASSSSKNIAEPILEEAGNEDKEKENSVYLDINEGTGVERSQVSVQVDDLAGELNGNGEIQQVLSSVRPWIIGKPVKNLTGPIRKEPDETAATSELGESYDEIVLEFEPTVHMMHTHNDYNMHCPYCSRQITKVVLRRKGVPVPGNSICGDLFGCSSCLSIFECIGNTLKPIIECLRRPGGDVQPPTRSDTSKPDATGTGNGLIPEPDIRDTPSGSSRSVEIVKSIVYGGLLESIASLSVVSSAAAADATTLNIVALGLGNLVGGLVVLVHNLRDLRFGKSNRTNKDRYKEELGKQEHFLLHATVAVLSYIIFGLIPPVIYAFTFRETNDRDFKMLAVAAAAFLCIIILAIAKVYGRGEHQCTYFKTVLYYLTSAIAASGVAFAVGDLAKKLIEQLGWLDSATVEPRSFQSIWASH